MKIKETLGKASRVAGAVGIGLTTLTGSAAAEEPTNLELQRQTAAQAKAELTRAFVSGEHPLSKDPGGDITILAPGGSCGTENTLPCDEWKVRFIWHTVGTTRILEIGEP